MTLNEQVTLICTQISKLDQDSQDACRMFLKRRLATVWNDQLWKDSVLQFDFQTTFTKPYETNGFILLPNSIDRVLGVRGENYAMAPVEPSIYYRQSVDAFTQVGTSLEYFEMCPVAWMENGSASNVEVVFTPELSSDSGISIHVRWRSVAQNEEVEDDFTLTYGAYQPLMFNGASDNPYEIISVTKGVSNGRIYLYEASSIGPPPLLTIFAADVQARQSPRIRLVQKPTAAMLLHVLAKRKVPTWQGDDSSPIRGADDVIMSLAHADMLRRSHQYGQARAIDEMALALLDQLKRVETVQNAHSQQIIPNTSFHALDMMFDQKGYW